MTICAAIAGACMPSAAYADNGPIDGGGGSCSSYHIVGVRGSGQQYEGPHQMAGTVGPAADQVADGLVESGVARSTIGFYSLNYPAVAVFPNVATGEYWNSVETGITKLANFLRDYNAVCPNTRFILIGFSQGAQVIHSSLDRAQSSNVKNMIKSVFLIADPIGNFRHPYAHLLGRHGDEVPRRTHVRGYLDDADINSQFRDRAVSICFWFEPNLGDVVCSGMGDSNTHGLYPTTGTVLYYWGREIARIAVSGGGSGGGGCTCDGGGGSGGAGGGGVPIGSAAPPSVRGGGTVADFNGDGKADVIAVNGGDMWLYPGNGSTLGSRTWLGNGWSGWATINAGDLTGDGKADIIATTTSGDMWLYPSNGAGLSQRRYLGYGWGTGIATISVGDLTGDGKADVVMTSTAGDMYVYPSNGIALSDRYFIGNGWTSGWGNINVADLTGDGKADVLAATTAGDLWVYPSNGTALGGRYWIGNGWAGNAALDFGDVAGADRKADAVLISTDGNLYFYPSNGTALGNSYWAGNGWTGYRIGG